MKSRAELSTIIVGLSLNFVLSTHNNYEYDYKEHGADWTT